MQTKLPVVIFFRLSFLYDNQHTIIAHVSKRFEGIRNETLWPLVLGEQPPPNPWSSVPRLWGDQATKRSWNELERHLIAPGNLPFVIPSISSNFMTSSKDSLPPKDTDWYFLRFAAEAGQAVQAEVILTSKEVPLSNYICWWGRVRDCFRETVGMPQCDKMITSQTFSATGRLALATRLSIFHTVQLGSGWAMTIRAIRCLSMLMVLGEYM